MFYRKPRVGFADYFSPAERSFTDWVSENPRSLLAASSMRRWAGESFDAEERADSGFDIRRALAPHQPGGPARAAPAGLYLLGGGEDEGGGGSRDRRTRKREQQRTGQQGTQPGTRTEPPRDVHPPVRPDPHCPQLRSAIISLREQRDKMIEGHRTLKGQHGVVRDKWIVDYHRLKELEERLRALEYQLKLLDQPYPLDPAKAPVPGKLPVGPVRDILEQGAVEQLKRDIAELRKRIDKLRGQVAAQGEEVFELERQIKAFEVSLRQADDTIAELERDYRSKCGAM